MPKSTKITKKTCFKASLKTLRHLKVTVVSWIVLVHHVYKLNSKKQREKPSFSNKGCAETFQTIPTRLVIRFEFNIGNTFQPLSSTSAVYIYLSKACIYNEYVTG